MVDSEHEKHFFFYVSASLVILHLGLGPNEKAANVNRNVCFEKR